jgi:hypothetical protein
VVKVHDAAQVLVKTGIPVDPKLDAEIRAFEALDVRIHAQLLAFRSKKWWCCLDGCTAMKAGNTVVADASCKLGIRYHV